MNTQHRNYDLDILRAFSVIIVLLFHFEFSFSGLNFFKSGFIGVDIFFFISGFILSKIYLKKKISYKTYIFKRIKRIYPILLFVLILINFSIYFLPEQLSKIFSLQSLFSIFGLLNYFYFFQNDIYFSNELYYDAPVKHLWSLSVEINFYIFFLFIIFLFNKTKKDFFIKTILILALLSLFFSNYISYINNNYAYYDTFSRLWQFLFGIMTYFLFQNLKIDSKFSFLIINFKIISLLFLLYFSQFYSNLNHPNFKSILILFYCMIILIPIDKMIFGTKKMESILFFSKISFSVFLIHYPILYFFNLISLKNSFIEFILKCLLICIIILFSYFSYSKIESRFIE